MGDFDGPHGIQGEIQARRTQEEGGAGEEGQTAQCRNTRRSQGQEGGGKEEEGRGQARSSSSEEEERAEKSQDGTQKDGAQSVAAEGGDAESGAGARDDITERDALGADDRLEHAVQPERILLVGRVVDDAAEAARIELGRVGQRIVELLIRSIDCPRAWRGGSAL